MKLLPLAIAFAFIAFTPAFANSVVLELNDQEQAAFQQMLDLATRQGGIQVAPTAVYLLNKLKTAPTVQSKTIAPAAPVTAPPVKPIPPKQTEGKKP